MTKGTNSDLTVTAVDAYEVTLPIEAPIRHSYGVHEAFTRTIIEIHTSGGLTGLGETAASAEEVRTLGAEAIGLNAYSLGVLRMRISQRFYWSSNALVAAGLEMGFIDLQAKAAGVPAYQILGGALRDHIDMAAYCFFRYPTEASPAVDTPETMAAHAVDLAGKYGYRTIKLKGGVLEPEVEVETLRQVRKELPDAHLRFDPNAAWTPMTAIRHAAAFEDLGLEYYEDPSPGHGGMARVRSRTRLPLATNMVVTDFDDIPAALAQDSVDVVLSDPWYWGGPTRTQALGQICHTLGLGLGMHSGIELGIGMAVMAHTGVTIPNLTLAVDAHYHHLTDDVIVGPRLVPLGDGRVSPPSGPGWGVELDRDKVQTYRELRSSGQYANLYVEGTSGQGPDPRRPGWRPSMPQW